MTEQNLETLLEPLWILAQVACADSAAFRPDLVIALAHSAQGPLQAVQTLWAEIRSDPFPPTQITNLGRDFDDLPEKAKTKDLGLQPFFMAGSLLQVRQFQHLPNTMPSLALPELQAFIMSLADRLLDQSRPPENRI